MKNITLSDSKRARLQMRALDAIHAGTQWLTAEQLDAVRMDSADHRAGATSQSQFREQLFSIWRDGHQVFPRYAFDEDLAPLPAMRSIVTTFHGWSEMRVAAWFESTSSFLEGMRPRELIASDPALVLRAAQDAVTHFSQC